MKLARSAFRRLVARRKLRVNVVVVTRGDDGSSRTLRRKATLRAPR